MKKLILIFTLLAMWLSTPLYGQNPLIDGRFASLAGNVFEANGSNIYTFDNLGVSVLSGKYTITQTGAQLQTILDGTFTGNLSIPALSQLYLDGGGDTYIRESAANQLDIVVGNFTFYRFYSTAPRYMGLPSGADIDFRVGWLSGNFGLIVEGNSGRVGIGTGTPDAELEIEISTNVDIELGAGTTDTDITYIKLRSPDGTPYWIYPTNGGGSLTISATKP